MGVRPDDPRAVRSRAKVLAAAAELLIEDGPGAFTVERVVERSGVSRMTIYRHWPSQEALLLDAFRHAVPDRGAPAAVAHADPVVELERTIRSYARDFREARWARMMPALLEQAHQHPELDAIREEHADARRRHLVSVLERCIAEGRLVPGLDHDLAVAQLVGPLAFRAMLSHEPVSDRVAREVVAAFVRAHAPD